MSAAESPLEGPRLRLRAPRGEDLPLLFDWYNDPELVAPFDRFSVDTFEGFERALAEAPGDPGSLAPRYVLERKEDGKLLGFVGHYSAHPVLSLTDVWYVLGEATERRKGYGQEAVGLLVTHLFATPRLARVGATCDVANLPSVRLLERLGFTREGTLRRSLFHHGTWHDVHYYGLTREEWTAKAPAGGS
ncbi:MAG: GNAT family N-acetyltransferase [Thermoplasmata archaeon]|nr:GNAT family N-acetyltransferase [Thermoplasmata archaeon]